MKFFSRSRKKPVGKTRYPLQSIKINYQVVLNWCFWRRVVVLYNQRWATLQGATMAKKGSR